MSASGVRLELREGLAGDERGSNSTRTEPCVAIFVIPGAQTRLDTPKAVDCNGYRQIIHPSWVMRAGLKTQRPTTRRPSRGTLKANSFGVDQRL